MTLLPGFWPYWNRRRLIGLVDRLTARVQNAVWRRVCDRLPAMGVHEARGYIRARAALVIDREMALAVISQPSLGATDRELVMRSVRHRVVRRLLLENMRRQSTTSQTGHQRHHRAA
jgi:hypothetical protein